MAGISFSAFVLLLAHGVRSLVVTEIHLQTKSTKDDYVLHGEGAILSCHYLLDPGESLTSVLWLKDHEELYQWRPNVAPVAMGAFKGRVDLSNRSPLFINITKASLEMAGLITCRVTQGGIKMAEDTFEMRVIVDACKENSFQTYTNMVKCSESITMRCVGMFPKPSPQCAIVNELTDTIIMSVPLDQVKQLRNKTYEVSLSRLFNIEDYINYTDISLSCNIVVTGTTWEKGIKHRLFGDRGCRSPPPEIENGSHNLTDGLTCWNDPQDGVKALYYCDSGFTLSGADHLLCRNGSWILGPSNVVSTFHYPTCNHCHQNTCSTILLLALMLFYLF